MGGSGRSKGWDGSGIIALHGQGRGYARGGSMTERDGINCQICRFWSCRAHWVGSLYFQRATGGGGYGDTLGCIVMRDRLLRTLDGRPARRRSAGRPPMLCFSERVDLLQHSCFTDRASQISTICAVCDVKCACLGFRDVDCEMGWVVARKTCVCRLCGRKGKKCPGC